MTPLAEMPSKQLVADLRRVGRIVDAVLAHPDVLPAEPGSQAGGGARATAAKSQSALDKVVKTWKPS